jgi:mannose-6-phosphate isomerase
MAGRLQGVVKDYAWGSREALYAFLGRPVEDRPAAELWFGAHPSGTATVEHASGTVPLDAFLAARPATLGGHPRLPFLVKVLAADRALSLQVHPDRQRAAAGHADGELTAGGQARYVDPAPKPEIVVALTPFRALSGFRPVAEVARVVDALGVPELASLVAPGPRPGDVLAGTLRALLELGGDRRDRLVAAVLAAASRCTADDDPAVARYAELVAVLAADHPGDVGIVAAALLHDVDLGAGEALFQPAGVPHAYVRGLGVEVMASSDNVFRCGLTTKTLDVEGLFGALDPTPRPPARPVVGSAGWVCPEGSFTLRRVECRRSTAVLPVTGPSIALCVEGSLEVDDGDRVALTRGQACFVDGSRPWAVLGSGAAFVAGAPPLAVRERAARDGGRAGR